LGFLIISYSVRTLLAGHLDVVSARTRMAEQRMG